MSESFSQERFNDLMEHIKACLIDTEVLSQGMPLAEFRHLWDENPFAKMSMLQGSRGVEAFNVLVSWLGLKDPEIDKEVQKVGGEEELKDPMPAESVDSHSSSSLSSSSSFSFFSFFFFSSSLQLLHRVRSPCSFFDRL
jgi:hypothetical protein